MPNLPNLSGSNIQDTYQRVLHTDGSLIYNGTGSVISNMPTTASFAITASHALEAVVEITKEVSSSYAETASMASDSFNVQGDITASGNISASEEIYANEFIVQDKGGLGSPDGTTLALDGGGQFSVLQYGREGTIRPHNFYGNITASGEISASGDIIASSSLSFNAPVSKVNFGNTGGGSDRFIVAGPNYMNIDGDDALNLYADTRVYVDAPSFGIGTTTLNEAVLMVDGDIKTEGTNGHITASGNISSSGTVTAAALSIPAGNALLGSGSLTLGNASTNVTLHSTGYITASGDISASGTILGHDAVFSGGVTAGSGGTNTDGLRIGAFGPSQAYLTNINGLRLQPNTLDPAQQSTPHVTIGPSAHLTASGEISASGFVYGDRGIFASRISSPAWRSDDISITANNGPINFVGTSGTEVTINCNTGEITASGNISSSGRINASQFRGSGAGNRLLIDQIQESTQGNGVLMASNFNFASPITASSNISSSGAVVGSSLNILSDTLSTGYKLYEPSSAGTLQLSAADGGGFNTFYVKSTDLEAAGNIEGATYTVNNLAMAREELGTVYYGFYTGLPIQVGKASSVIIDNKLFTGHITASGEISTSEAVTANEFALGETGDQNLRIYKSADNAFIKSNINDASINFGGVHNTVNTTGLSLDFANKSVIVNPGFSITCSGEISSSDDLYGAGLYLNDEKFVDYHPGGEHFRISGNGIPINIFADITSSGNISGSSTSTILTGGTISTRNNIFLGEGAYSNHKLYFGPVAGDKQFPVINANALYEMQIQRGSLESPLLQLFFNQHGAEPSKVNVSGSLQITSNSLAFGPKGGSLFAQGDITSSGHISSSKNATFDGITLTDSNYDANGTAKYRVDGYSVIQNSSDTLKIAGNNYWTTITYGNEDTDRHSFTGAVTASGTISASNHIYGKTHYGDGFQPRSGASNISIGSIGTNTQDYTITVGHHTNPAPLTIHSSITASSTISASKTIAAASITAVGIVSATSASFVHGTLNTRNFYTGSLGGGVAHGDIARWGRPATSVVAGRIYYFADGEWTIADNTSAASATGLLGISLGTDPAQDGMLLRGIYHLGSDNGTSGNILYLDDSNGVTTETKPSLSGKFVRIVGYNLGDADGGIWFDPDKTWVELV